MKCALFLTLTMLLATRAASAAALLPGMPPAAAEELPKLARAGLVSLAALEIREIFKPFVLNTTSGRARG